MNKCYLLVSIDFYYDNLELYNKKRGFDGEQKEEEKTGKETKVYKEQKGTEHTFFTKSSHYDRENISVYLYGSVCNFVYVFIWSVLQFWDNS